jgi:hypothetical protein
MFDWKIYLHNYPDLMKNGIDTEKKATEHWRIHGKKEKRVADRLSNPLEFNWVIYLNNNPDLLETNVTTEKEALNHWLLHGKKENRVANKDMVGHIHKSAIIKTNETEKEFIKLSLKYLKLLRILPVQPISKNSVFEAVFIEYKCISYSEFVIRNTIFKLGEKWSHTVICGTLNYEYMNTMCQSISPNIKVIQTNHSKMNENEYNKFLSSMEFWDLFYGSKILLYNKKSFLIKSNVEEFLNWDYISLPFSKLTIHCEPSNIGSSGFTLRTKEIMKEIISKISIHDTQYLEATREYTEKNKLDYPPENIYFSKNMQDLKIGKVADYETAKKFCIEFHSIKKYDSFAGYNFWDHNKEWKNIISSSMNYKNYSFERNLDKYLEYYKNTKTPRSKIKVKEIYERKNYFDIDFHFYKIVNKINNSLDICKHFHDYGMYGLVYHPRQLLNIYPKIEFKNLFNHILIKMENKYYTSQTFVNEFVYKKTFEEMHELFIKKEVDKMDTAVSPLLILAFMGNETRGKDLLEKIKKYKKIQKFNIAFCFNATENFDDLKKEIENEFTHYSIYNCIELGTDITPTLLMYHDIKKLRQFQHIIKLQTKSVSKMYHDLTNYLLNKPFIKLVGRKPKNSNCIGENNSYAYVNNNEDVFNKILLHKYKSHVHFDNKFVKGTIFSCETKVFDAVLKFIENNNYQSYLLNNFYENNSINYDNSPIHYLERLFGIIIC